jgi:hypothetical protein
MLKVPLNKKKLILMIFPLILIGIISAYIYASHSSPPPAIVEPGSMVTEASYIIFTDGAGNYYARNGSTGKIEFSGTDAATIIQQAINSGGLVFVKNGTYNFNSFIFTNIISGGGLVGESMTGVIFDLTNAPTNHSGVISVDQYATIVIRSRQGFRLENITIKNHKPTVGGSAAAIGFGEHNSNCLATDVVVRNIRFIKAYGLGIAFKDGSRSIIENVVGDNPENIVSFWGGSESDIILNQIQMTPTYETGMNGPRRPDDTISFNPDANAISKNIFVQNVKGDYSVFKMEGGTGQHIGAVVDFAGFGGVQYINLTVKNIVALYAQAVSVGYKFNGLINAVFENIYSSFSGGGNYETGTHFGIGVRIEVGENNVIVKNVILKDIFVDRAFKSGVYFQAQQAFCGANATGIAFISNITFQNIHSWNNNQAGDSYGSGLIIGIDMSNCSPMTASGQLDHLVLTNISAWDDQPIPTQRYPIFFTNVGPSGTSFTNLEISGLRAFGNESDNKPYFVGDITLKKNSGVATFSGDGKKVSFSFAHGLTSTPKIVIVTPGSTDAKGDFYVTYDAKNITITYGSAPPSGTNNVILIWYAEM